MLSPNPPTQGQVVGIIIQEANPNQNKAGVGHQYYVPTAEDLAIVCEFFPDADPENPSWTQIEAFLILTGMDQAELRKHTAATLIRFLQRALSKDKETHTAQDAFRRMAKKSTESDEARTKLIATLTKHHKYDDSSCLNLIPIGNNELARAARVSISTASKFFNDEFKGHALYKVICRDSSKLAAALKLLNKDFAPHHLLGSASSEAAAAQDNENDTE